MVGKINYYDILEISSSEVNSDKIEKNYKELKNYYRSESFKELSGFTETEINQLIELLDEAYAVLGNSTLKSIYDEKIKTPHSSTAFDGFKNLPSDKSSSYRSSDSQENHPKPPESLSNKSSLKNKKSEFHTKIVLQYTKDSVMEEWIKTCTEWTGENLKKARIYKCIDLNKLSEITKINSFYLNAIEEMEPQNLPAPVFVRGYLTQYARALELPEEMVVKSYLKRYQQKCDRKHKDHSSI